MKSGYRAEANGIIHPFFTATATVTPSPPTFPRIRSTITITSSNYNIVPFPYTYIVCVYIYMYTVFTIFATPTAAPRWFYKRCSPNGRPTPLLYHYHYYHLSLCAPLPTYHTASRFYCVWYTPPIVPLSQRIHLIYAAVYMVKAIFEYSFMRILGRQSQSVIQLLFYHFSIRLRILYYDVYLL